MSSSEKLVDVVCSYKKEHKLRDDQCLIIKIGDADDPTCKCLKILGVKVAISYPSGLNITFPRRIILQRNAKIIFDEMLSKFPVFKIGEYTCSSLIVRCCKYIPSWPFRTGYSDSLSLIRGKFDIGPSSVKWINTEILTTKG